MSLALSVSLATLLNHSGGPIHASESRRSPVFTSLHGAIQVCDLFVRDCTSQNIMLDPSRMYPKSFHPMVIGRTRDFRGKVKGRTRTWCRPRYFLIDLGLSRQYDLANGPPLEIPLRGGDKSAPEHRDMETPCNPFPTDVYYLGNLVREGYIQVRPKFVLKSRPC